MGAKERREQERIDAKERRKKEVIEAAKQVFAKKTIEKASMKDIALEAEVGVASVYRYYSTKMMLVAEVAVDYLNKDFNYKYLGCLSLQGKGIEQTGQVIDGLYNYLLDRPDMLRFFEEFEYYLMCQQIERKDEYNVSLIKDMGLFKKVIQNGKEDGSIRKEIDEDEVVYIFIELLMKIIQKTTAEKKVRRVDYQLRESKHLKLYKEMVIKYLSTA